VIFSSGTIQYLLPEKRETFINALKEHTNTGGINVLHTFVKKPFIEIAPDAEANEHLWASGELLFLYKDWMTEQFLEEIKPCNSSGVPHSHAHNRIWSRKL
jgi:tellurite methyltransferase